MVVASRSINDNSFINTDSLTSATITIQGSHMCDETHNISWHTHFTKRNYFLAEPSSIRPFRPAYCPRTSTGL